MTNKQTATDAAVWFIHDLAQENGGAFFSGMDFVDGSHGVVLGLHLDDPQQMHKLLDALRELVGSDVPDGAAHLAELELARSALGSLGGYGSA